MRLLRFLLRLLLAGVGAALGTAVVAKRNLRRIDHPDAEEINIVAIFDDVDTRNASPSFRGGRVWTMFGGCRLDLRRAEIPAEEGASLQVTTMFGGTAITVPDTWSVRTEGPTVAGGVKANVPGPADLEPGAPRLAVTTRTLFGGVLVTARPVLRAAE